MLSLLIVLLSTRPKQARFCIALTSIAFNVQQRRKESRFGLRGDSHRALNALQGVTHRRYPLSEKIKACRASIRGGRAIHSTRAKWDSLEQERRLPSPVDQWYVHLNFGTDSRCTHALQKTLLSCTPYREPSSHAHTAVPFTEKTFYSQKP
ncbi:hypothetical protein GOP47_0030996 [Adiantum capillus-veneris]|nr:hypothetical protein GOP47_0030996 [Adiantum capillus-veneris]